MERQHGTGALCRCESQQEGLSIAAPRDGNAASVSQKAPARPPRCQSDSSETQLSMLKLLPVCDEDISPWIWMICQKSKLLWPKKYQRARGGTDSFT